MATKLEHEPEVLPPGLSVEIHFPDTQDLVEVDDEEEADDQAWEEAEKRVADLYSNAHQLIDNELDPLFDSRWDSPGRPPWAGDHYAIVLFVAKAAAGGFAWDVIKTLARKIQKLATHSKDNDLRLEFNEDGLLTLALGHAAAKERDFATAQELVRTIADDLNTDFPLAGGVYLFQIPNLRTENTHLVVLNTLGDVLAHHIDSYFSNDATMFKEENNQWAWGDSEEWAW